MAVINNIPTSIIIGAVIILILLIIGFVVNKRNNPVHEKNINWILGIASLVVTLVAIILGYINQGSDNNVTPNVGSNYRFGGFDWRVLDIQNDRMLLISEYIILNDVNDGDGFRVDDLKPFWMDSYARDYLNDTFLYTFFREEERERILLTTVIPDAGVPVNGSLDKVFLLSVDEAWRFFPNDDGRIAFAEEKKVAGVWWLRTIIDEAYAYPDRLCPGLHIARIMPNGEIDDYHGDKGLIWSGLRPAIWLNIID